MITDRNADIQVKSTLVGEKYDMGIDPTATNHIMDILSGSLYSDPELAVLREYSTNALDAQIEAGVNLPIEVTLPDYLNPFLRIKDRGIGMSKDDIRNTYSQYGASTKRATNDQVGMLGLGCKSAFAYASQFTLTGIKDGVRVQVSISRDNDGAGAMNVVDESETTEPNGVEIIIPAKAGHDFSTKANNFFKYWAKGTVLVNGVDPHQDIVGLQITDNIWVVEGDSQKVVVMGNVAYPAEIDHGLSYEYGVVAFVGIGDVHFVPSREALHYTKKTKAVIERIERTILRGIEASAQEHIDKCATGYEAVLEAKKWRKMFDSASNSSKSVSFSWKGNSPIPSEIKTKTREKLPDGTLGPQAVFTTTRHDSSVISDHHVSTSIEIEEREHPTYFSYSSATQEKVFIQNYDATKFTVTMKKKLKKWAEDNLTTTPYLYVLSPDPIPKEQSQWLRSPVYEWADVKSVVLPRNTLTKSGRIPRAFDGFDEDGERSDRLLVPDFDSDLDVFYCGTNDSASSIHALLSDLNSDFYLVQVPTSRLAKFLRDVPRAKEAVPALKGTFAPWFDSLSKKEQHYLRARSHTDFWVLGHIDPKKIDDPDLSLLASIAKDVEAGKSAFSDVNLKYMHYCAVLPEECNIDEIGSPLKKYPLFSTTAINLYESHVYSYMNLVHANSLDAAV